LSGRAAAALLLAVAMGGCTSTEKVAISQAGDEALSCEQLQAEFARLDRVVLQAQGNKGMNAANVTAALLFSPAMLANMHNAEKAEELVEQRRGRLMRFYKQKNCG
jgi:hypothetical protein